MPSNERIRIIQLIAGLDIGDHEGGAEYFGVQLARFLNKQEFKVAVFAMWYGNSETEQKWLNLLKSEGLQIAGLVERGSRPWLNLVPIWRKLWAFANTFKPDIIHSHSQRGDLLVVLTKAFHPLHPLGVRTVHVDQMWLNRSWADFVFSRTLFPLVFDAEVAVSKAVQTRLNSRKIAQIFNRQAKLCYNGIDASFFSEDFQKKLRDQDSSLGPRQTEPCIGFVGRLAIQKGVPYLLHALYLVRRKNRRVHLLIIGAGPLESELQQQVQNLGLSEWVHFLGKRQDVMKILPQLDALVLPSLWEGLPTVLLEAMALRIPVIATNVSGTCEIIRDQETGILVPPKDPRALAEAIIRILDNPAKARQMAEHGYKVACNYTLQNSVMCYTRIYRQLLKDRTLDLPSPIPEQL